MKSATDHIPTTHKPMPATYRPRHLTDHILTTFTDHITNCLYQPDTDDIPTRSVIVNKLICWYLIGTWSTRDRYVVSKEGNLVPRLFHLTAPQSVTKWKWSVKVPAWSLLEVR